MARKRGLGKGLDALIPGDTETISEESGVLEVLVKDISPNPRQPRVEFDPAHLQELANSISEHGILQPLLVSPLNEGGGYQLIIGERRLQAARLAGLEAVPVIPKLSLSVVLSFSNLI